MQKLFKTDTRIIKLRIIMFFKCVHIGLFIICSLVLRFWYFYLSIPYMCFIRAIQKLTLKTIKKRLNSNIERKLVSSKIAQLICLSLKKNARHFKAQEESQEVLNTASKQNCKIRGYIHYDSVLDCAISKKKFPIKKFQCFFFFSHCYVWFHWYNVDFVSICKYRTYLNIIEFMLKPLLLGHTSPDGCKNLYFEFCLSKWPRNLKGVLLWTVNSRKCDCLRKAEMIPGIRQYTFSFLVPVWETWNVRH